MCFAKMEIGYRWSFRIRSGDDALVGCTRQMSKFQTQIYSLWICQFGTRPRVIQPFCVRAFKAHEAVSQFRIQQLLHPGLLRSSAKASGSTRVWDLGLWDARTV